EPRVRAALEDPQSIQRFGGLCLGESTHLVNEVKLLPSHSEGRGEALLLAPSGRFVLPVWVDHLGSAGTRYETAEVEDRPLTEPPRERMPMIQPRDEEEPYGPAARGPLPRAAVTRSASSAPVVPLGRRRPRR